MRQRTRAFLTVAVSGLLLVCAVAAVAQGPKRRAPVTRPPAQALQMAPGTPIEVRLLSEINSGEAKDGDTFTATLAKPVVVEGRTVLAKDTRVTGRVVRAVSSGRLKTTAALTLELLSAGGQSLRTEPVTLDGKSHAGRNAALIGGGAAAGAIIGAIAGGGKGAAIGAATGAGAGTATAYLTGKKELVLPPEFLIGFVTAGGSGAPGGGGTGIPGPPRPADQAPTAYLFSGSDRNVISNYLRTNRANLPPGLARRESLPPGLERQLQRNGTLPPGLQKRLQPFPADLNRQLPLPPAGVSRMFLGRRALLLDQAQRILDMFTVEE